MIIRTNNPTKKVSSVKKEEKVLEPKVEIVEEIKPIRTYKVVVPKTEPLVTLIDEDDVFVWSIIIGPGESDEIRYVLVDWKKDGKSYRYEH